MSEETNVASSSSSSSAPVDSVESSGTPAPVVAEGDSTGSSKSTSTSTSKLFIGGIPWSTTDATFTQFFSKFGELQDSVIIRDKHTKASRGFGFVKFTDPTAVDKVLAEELMLDGRKLEVKVAIPKEDMDGPNSQKTKKLFIGGLSQATTDVDFREHFSQYGTIVDAVVMVDKDSGRSRCFGFITYDSEDAAEKVLAQTHTLNGKVCEIKKAVPKEDMDHRSSRGDRRGRGRYDRDDYGYADDYYSYGPRRGRYDDDYYRRDRGYGYGDYGRGGGYDGGYGGWGGGGGAYGGRDGRAYHPYQR